MNWTSRAPTLALGGLLLTLGGWRVIGRASEHAIGRGDSACPDHIWGLWVTAAGLAEHGPFLRDTEGAGWPDGFRALQYEAPNLLAFLPGYWLGGGGVSGAVLGWNAAHLGALALAVFGCWQLGRHLLGARPELAVLAAAFAGSAFFASHPAMGHSEYLAVSAYPLHLALLGRFLEVGGWWRGALAALLLGGMAATASYLPVFLALTELPLALVLARRAPGLRLALTRLLAVALPAVAMVGLFVWALSWPWPTGHGAFAGQRGVGRPPLALADLLHGLTRLWPGRLDVRSGEIPGYPGVVLLGMALIGGLRRPRSALPWLGAGLACWVLSAGTAVRVGEAIWTLPAGWLSELVPTLRSVHWWERLGCLTPLPLGVAALWALDGARGRVWLAWLLPLGLLADAGTFPGQRTWPWPSFDLSPPPELAGLVETLPPGALMHLPLPLVHLPGKAVATGPYLLWQPQHGRPVTTVQTLQGDRLLGRSYLAGVVGNRQVLRGRPERVPGSSGTLDETELACARTDAARLGSQGLAAVVLHTRLGRGSQLESLLEQILGESEERGGLRSWTLPGRHAWGPPCSPPPLARALGPVVPPSVPMDARPPPLEGP